MHIVINTSVLLTPATGVGTYVYESARALKSAGGDHRYTCYDGRFSETLPHPAGSAARGFARGVKRLLDRFPAARGVARGVTHRLARGAARSRRFDVYWEPNYVPLPLDAKRLVVTVHDLSLRTHPEWHPKDRVAYFARHFAAGLDRADVIVAVSEFTKRELVDLYPLDPTRVRVVYPGCDLSRFHPREKSATGAVFPDRFVLVVGSPKDARKNISRLLEAWAMLPAALRKEFKVVVAGAPPSASGLRASADVVRLGYLNRDDLAAAYASAAALVYPSLYEGFGLPPLEAMASGCPVVASDIPPVHEVCGDCAEFVDPASAEAIAAGLERVLSDDSRRRSLADSGLERAKRFTWSATARGLLELFEGR